MKKMLCLSLLLVVVIASGYAQTSNSATSAFIYIAQEDARKLGDIGADEELWAITVTLPSSSSPIHTDVPASLTLILRTKILLTKKQKEPRKYAVAMTEGTEVKLGLTRRSNGSYETVYFLDQTKSWSLSN
jgi:hypothetical protein